MGWIRNLIDAWHIARFMRESRSTEAQAAITIGHHCWPASSPNLQVRGPFYIYSSLPMRWEPETPGGRSVGMNGRIEGSGPNVIGAINDWRRNFTLRQKEEHD